MPVTPVAEFSNNDSTAGFNKRMPASPSPDDRASDALRLSGLDTANFGARLEFDCGNPDLILDLCHRHAQAILDAFYAARGLLVVKGLQQFTRDPAALVTLSRMFGNEVEVVRDTLTSDRFFHESVDEIMVLGNAEPCNHRPPPKAVGREDGSLPTRFPDQRNWHTDQSYRRPPPDITLLLAVELPPRQQGQTLFADCTAALESLETELQQRLRALQGIHAPGWVGRSRAAVERGEKPRQLLPHQLPQRQPLVRKHPVTGAHSLYLCEEKQMDFIDGPIAGLAPGPDGEGAALLRALLAQATRDEFVYVHEWEPGDLVIADNRNLLHCATWYDADRFTRLMWRTTVRGNPGDEYAGEGRSWLPRDGHAVMAGMEDA